MTPPPGRRRAVSFDRAAGGGVPGTEGVSSGIGGGKEDAEGEEADDYADPGGGGRVRGET